ncbi:MAG: FtsX-like permease family protein [Ignavibacteria bacterium]
MNVEFFVAKRYLFSKRKLNFITVISLISVLGVTIGVAAMIIVLSVFNGFQNRVTSLLVGFDPHIRIEAADSKKITDFDGLSQKLVANNIKYFAPFTLNKAMLATSTQNKVIFIKGVDEESTAKATGIRNAMVYGEFNLSNTSEVPGIILGLSLADQLKSEVGDTLTVISPVGLEYALTQFVEPITKQFVVVGIYDSENKEYDSKYAYISLTDASDLFRTYGTYNGIDIRLDNINQAEEVKQNLASALGNEFTVSTWYDLHSDFYSILKIERWTAFIILSLIIIVATFNILGSLTMTVIEKKRDIGILRAMGATPQTITKIFMFEGIAVGLIGMVAGTILGLGITLAQKQFELYKISSSIYKIRALPVELSAIDFIAVPLAALFLCYIASLYPAKRAAKLNPVESIRWE